MYVNPPPPPPKKKKKKKTTYTFEENRSYLIQSCIHSLSVRLLGRAWACLDNYNIPRSVLFRRFPPLTSRRTAFRGSSNYELVFLLYFSMNYTGWRPVVAVFCNILFSCNRHIVLSDSIFWFNKLGVNVGTLLLYFFK